ncbi:MAG: response regulator [Planctomycetia bacterium]|nr:response regulator [Planctomycetia bacterium]
MESNPPAPRTILVAEDDAVTREGLASILQRAGYTVAGAAHGQEALDYLLAHSCPQLILLDMLMPVLDGWLFLRELRRLPGCAEIPVIVVTGMSVASPEWTQALGAVALVRKPVDVGHLLEIVQRHV